MGRTSPVVRAGLVALGRHGGVMVTAVTATATVLLAGCGTHTADLPARGHRGPAATASPGPAASTGPGPGRGLPAGSRAGAQALAHRLLARLVLPAAGRPVRMRALWGDTGLIGAAQRMLHIRSVL